MEHSFRSAFAFGWRQYKFVGWYLPHLWLIAAATTTIPFVTGASAVVLALKGDRFAMLALVLAFALARASVRLMIVRKAFDAEAQRAYRATADAAVRLLAPAWIALHAAAVWSTLVSRRMVWSGTTYAYLGNQRTRVLSRSADAPAAPRAV